MCTAVHTVARSLAAAQTLAEDMSAGGTNEQPAACTMVVKAALVVQAVHTVLVAWGGGAVCSGSGMLLGQHLRLHVTGCVFGLAGPWLQRFQGGG